MRFSCPSVDARPTKETTTDLHAAVSALFVLPFRLPSAARIIGTPGIIGIVRIVRQPVPIEEKR